MPPSIFASTGLISKRPRRFFEDPFAITILDELHSEGEERGIVLGFSLLSRVLLVVHTERKERIRFDQRKAGHSFREVTV